MSETDLRRAEQDVKRSSSEFNRSMDHLQEAFEDGSRKVSDVVEKVQRPKVAAQNFATKVRKAYGQGRDAAVSYSRQTGDIGRRLYSRARDAASPAIRSARERPAVLWSGLAVLVGGAIALSYYLISRRSGSEEASGRASNVGVEGAEVVIIADNSGGTSI